MSLKSNKDENKINGPYSVAANHYILRQDDGMRHKLFGDFKNFVNHLAPTRLSKWLFCLQNGSKKLLKLRSLIYLMADVAEKTRESNSIG